ncbi:MAG TPA: FISUMP domain-containing protein [Longimicrobium sp.]|nr:FISUMP domain-containing protein [Longimicrobium sp.]
MIFIDPRDGNEYRTVVLPDGRRWLAENLRFEIRDSDPGSYPRLVESFPADPHPRADVLATNPEYDSRKYGRLYTWVAAQRAAPPGWHVPSAKEWKRLFNCYGGWTRGIHEAQPEKNNVKTFVRVMDVEFGGCLRASSAGALNRAIELVKIRGASKDATLPSGTYMYFGGFMGARFWSSSQPLFGLRQSSGIYFLIRPNPAGGPIPRSDPSAHESEEVLDYAFSVRCIADKT